MFMKYSFRYLSLFATLALLQPAAGCGDDSGATNENNNNEVVAECGNGVVEGAEECDDPAGNSDTVVDACRTSCVAAHCGDGVVDTVEACDDGADNSDTVVDACRTTCAVASCGDGVVDTVEACDDGADNSDTVADACRTGCVAASCGDGVADTGEDCDDGNGVNDDACTNACVAQPYLESTLVWQTGTLGSGDGELEEVGDIAVDADGNLYVCDYLNDRVQKFDADGDYVLQWSYTRPQDIDVDELGDVYVWGDFELRKFTSQGAEISAYMGLGFGTQLNADCRFSVSRTGDELAVLNLSGLVQNINPLQVVTNNASEHHVVLTTKSGATFLGQFDGQLSTSSLNQPYVAVYGSTGLLHVLDTQGGRIAIYDGANFVEDSTVVLSGSATYDGFTVDHADRIYHHSNMSLGVVDIYSADGAITDSVAVDYSDSHSYGLPKNITTYYDSLSGATYLYSTSRSTVFKYELIYENW